MPTPFSVNGQLGTFRRVVAIAGLSLLAGIFFGCVSPAAGNGQTDTRRVPSPEGVSPSPTSPPSVAGSPTAAAAVSFTQTPAPSPIPTKPPDCPKLEPRLRELVTAADPAAAAARLGLPYQDGRVRVLIELADARQTPTHPDLTPAERLGDLLQGWIRPQSLCIVSDLPEIRFVRSPSAAAPQAR